MSQSLIAFEHTELSADGAAYIEALYEDFLTDPDSVSADWRAYFAKYRQNQDAPTKTHRTTPSKSNICCLPKIKQAVCCQAQTATPMPTPSKWRCKV